MELDQFLPSVSEPTEASYVNESVEARTIFYRLGESEVFQYANKNTALNGVKLIDIIPQMSVDGHGFRFVDFTQLDKTIQYELFEGPKYRISSRMVMRKMIESGKVQMVYSDEYRVPTAIPYIVQTASGKARIFVNITDFVTMDQYGKYQIEHSRNYAALFAILFAACISYQIVSSGITLPADIADTMVLMYANMLERVINSLVHMDPLTRDKVRYLATKFALIQMYGTQRGEDLFYRYSQKYFPKLTKLITDTMDSEFHLDHFDKLSLFVEELKRLYPSMKGLSDYLIYDKWIRSYGSSTAMSIDYFGYHIYTVSMILFESPLISRIALEPILEKNKGSELYKRLPMMLV